MCGIAGWIDFHGDMRVREPALRAMQRTLEHRGPDSGGMHVDRRAGLVHRRLAVVDPENGAQPMVEGRYVLVYNGELYNTEEIRVGLLKEGWAFRGHSDTEVLLKAYVQWGEECLERFSGIYAFAVWDGETLFAARDRVGVKPFFFIDSRDGLLFGSSVQSLMAAGPWCGEARPKLDAEGRRELFLLGPGKRPGSGVLKGYRELEPVECLRYDRGGLRTRRYWRLKARPHAEGREETVAHVRELVSGAVQRQLVSDVPLCAMLSGGLDSSILSALAAENYRKEGWTLDTWSVDYRDNYDYFHAGRFVPSEDAPFVRQMAEHIGSNHHFVTLDNRELADALIPAALERGLPGMADVDSSLMLFCREIKRRFTVGLSGECADELFGGYPWYHREEILFEACFPWSRTTAVREAILSPDAVPGDGEGWLREVYSAAVRRADSLPGEDAHAVRMRQMFVLNFEWFMQTLLMRKDAMSMACGLEMRVPFADERIVEYAYNLPWALKSLDGREKGVLRAAFEDVLTPDVAWRKKSPYPKTFHPAYLARVAELLHDRMHRPGGRLRELVNEEAVGNLIRDPDALKEPWYGQLMRAPQVLAWLVMLDVWLERYNVELI